MKNGKKTYGNIPIHVKRQMDVIQTHTEMQKLYEYLGLIIMLLSKHIVDFSTFY